MLCSECRSGYRAPYERYERVATDPSIPAYLMRCRQCGALWHETSGPAVLVTRADARWRYPQARI